MLRSVSHLISTLFAVRILIFTFSITASLYAQNYKIFFGDLHSHTYYSDGQGSPAEAFLQARQYGADFLAITDHSYSGGRSLFDSTTIIADQHTTEDFVAIASFEMTKSWGHMVILNTQWYEWRDMDRDSFYALLLKDSMCIAQWNHPMEMLDEFNDFQGYSPQLDKVINLLEIINMKRNQTFESSYIKALDQGWHVAPTANSDCHRKEWIKDYSARTAILATDLTREKLFEAMRKRRVYSTENSNLQIFYSINDSIMGSILHRVSQCLVKINISDPDTFNESDRIVSVQIIANGGEVVASTSCMDHKAQWSLMLDENYRNYSYYYVKVKNSRGEYAYTAPIWIEEYVEWEKPAIPEINKEIAVYDISGRLVHKQLQDLRKNPRELSNGVYIIKRSGGTKTSGVKVLTLQR